MKKASSKNQSAERTINESGNQEDEVASETQDSVNNRSKFIFSHLFSLQEETKTTTKLQTQWVRQTNLPVPTTPLSSLSQVQ